MSEEIWWKSKSIISGFDIGKRGNPSHHSIFAIDKIENPLAETEEDKFKEILIMIHSKFLDSWDYLRQIEYLKACAEHFGIQRCYYDNTRAEFDERNLSPRVFIPVILSNVDGAKSKGKPKLAAQFAKLVEEKRIQLIDDDRTISQITCVNNDLQAPSTPLGHADSFISIILAIGVYYDFYAQDRKLGFSNLGDIQQIFGDKKPDLKSRNSTSCRICGCKTFDQLPGGHTKCTRCATIW